MSEEIKNCQCCGYKFCFSNSKLKAKDKQIAALKAELEKANEPVSVEDFMLIKEPCTIEELKPLIGQEIEVNDIRLEYGKPVTIADKIVITNIKLTVDVESGKSNGYSALCIYSDYYIKGKFRFNAWTNLAGVKKMIKALEGKK